MNKYIIVSCLIAITFGVTINLSSTCSCSDYHQQTECQSYGHCQWTSSSTCVDFPCSTYNAVTNCTSATPQSAYCYWSGSSCNKFTTCSAISGNSIANCTAQNPACSWASGTNCVSATSCTLNPTIAACPAATCNNLTTTCTDYTSCDQRKIQAACTGIDNLCMWNSNTNICSAAVCSNLKNDTSCTQVKTGTTVTPCVQGASGCTDADPSSFNQTVCASNTYGLYHWSTNSTTDGSCISCYAIIVQIMFAFILLLA